MKQQRSRTRRQGREFWAGLVGEFESSERSHDEFAQRKGVNVLTFRTWLYRLRRERRVGASRQSRGGGGGGGGKRSIAATGSGRVRRRRAQPTSTPLQFVELPVARDDGFEVVLTNGRRVKVPAGFEESSLARLLAVVERA